VPLIKITCPSSCSNLFFSLIWCEGGTNTQHETTAIPNQDNPIIPDRQSPYIFSCPWSCLTCVHYIYNTSKTCEAVCESLFRYSFNKIFCGHENVVNMVKHWQWLATFSFKTLPETVNWLSIHALQWMTSVFPLCACYRSIQYLQCF